MMYIDSVRILDGFKKMIIDFANRYTIIKSNNESLINSTENSAMSEIRDAEDSKQNAFYRYNTNLNQEEIEKRSIETDLMQKIAVEKQYMNSRIETINKEFESKKMSINNELLYYQSIEDIFVALFSCQKGVYKKSKHYDDEMMVPEELQKYYSECSNYILGATPFYWYEDLHFEFGISEAPYFVQDARNRLGWLNEENTSAEDFIMMLCKEINGANSLDGKLFKKKLLREHKENAIYIFIQFRCYMNKYAQSLMNDLQTVNSENKKRCNHIHEDFENKVADLQAAAARLIETHDNTIARLKAEYPSVLSR